MTDFTGFFSISKMRWIPEHGYRSNIKISSSLYHYENKSLSRPEKLKFRNLQLTALQAIAIYQQHPCALHGTEGTTEEGICIHAMKVYYINVHKVTNKGCTGNLQCKYFQKGKGK